MTLRSRNLDGEGSSLIRPAELDEVSERPNQTSPLKDIIGSIQKGFQKRNAFDSTVANPLNRKYESEMRQFDNEDDCKSHRSSLSACSSQQRLSIRNNLKKDTTDSVIYEVEIFPKERVDTKDIIQVCSEANLVSLKARDEEAQQSYKLKFKEKKDSASKVEEILKHFEKLGTVKSSHSQHKEALSPIKTARKPSQNSN